MLYFKMVIQIVVLLVGTNNTNHTAEEVAEGIFEIVKVIREKLPDTYIVLPVIQIASFFPNRSILFPFR